MRIDKFLTETGTCSRSEAGKAVRRGDVLLNGKAVRSASEQINPEVDQLIFRGEEIVYRKFTYILLNKPEGVVSATEDGDVTVIDLLPEQLQRLSLFPCGRLDKYTVGFVLLTNNGPLSHKLLSPKHHPSRRTHHHRSLRLRRMRTALRAYHSQLGHRVRCQCVLRLHKPRERQRHHPQ